MQNRRAAIGRASQPGVAQSSDRFAGGHLGRIRCVVAADRRRCNRGVPRFPGSAAQAWMRAGQLGLSEEMQGDQPLERLGDNVRRVPGALSRCAGRRRFHCRGRPLPAFRRATPFPRTAAWLLVRAGDGLVGQAAKDGGPLRVRDVPAGYLPIAPAIGTGTPAELLIAPASIDGVVQAVLEFGFFGARADGEPRAAARASGVARRRRARRQGPQPPRGTAAGDSAAGRGAADPARRSCASATRNSKSRRAP